MLGGGQAESEGCGWREGKGGLRRREGEWVEQLVDQLVADEEGPGRVRAQSTRAEERGGERGRGRGVGPILNLTFREFIREERLLGDWQRIEADLQLKERNSNSTADSETGRLQYIQMLSYLFGPRVEDEFAINPGLIESDKRTAIMIKNIPNKYSQTLLVDELNERFRDQYDFLYLPIDPKNRCNVGYAFINFTSTRAILDFYYAYNGKRWRRFNSEKVCELRYARMQGRQSLLKHFQGSQKERAIKHG
jgi:hypothetical protein